MSAGGGNGPIDPALAVGGAAPVDATEGAEEVAHVESATTTEAASQITEISGTTPLPNASAIDRVTADFQAGRIDRPAAVEALIEAVLPAHTEGASRADLKALMLELAEHDVYLQSLIARLDASR